MGYKWDDEENGARLFKTIEKIFIRSIEDSYKSHDGREGIAQNCRNGIQGKGRLERNHKGTTKRLPRVCPASLFCYRTATLLSSGPFSGLHLSSCLSSLTHVRVPPSDNSAPSPSSLGPKHSWTGSSRTPKLGWPFELHKEEALATGKRRCESISGFTSLLSDGVLHSTAREIADALLEVLDVFLVGGGEFIDLV